jgi:hypothetical protein
MTDDERTYWTDRHMLASRLREAGIGSGALDEARRQEMIRLADALMRGERVEVVGPPWLFDYMGDVPLTGKQYTGLSERVVVEPDGTVTLWSSA